MSYRIRPINDQRSYRRYSPYLLKRPAAFAEMLAVMFLAFVFNFGFSICYAETSAIVAIENQPPLATTTPSATTGWKGTLALGAMAIAQYTGGKQLQALPLPLLSINYNDTFYVEVQRVGVYVLASDDKKLGLGFAMEPRLGFHESDGIKLGGMATRRHSLESGMTLDYDADVFAVSAALFTDVTKSSRGASARLSLYRPLVKNNRGEIGLLASADRMSARTANYFFGVNAAEATSFRPPFSARAGTNISVGIGGTYRSAVDSKDAFIFGANVGRLAPGVARSPIVETNRTSQIYLGYGWAL